MGLITKRKILKNGMESTQIREDTVLTGMQLGACCEIFETQAAGEE